MSTQTKNKLKLIVFFTTLIVIVLGIVTYTENSLTTAKINQSLITINKALNKVNTALNVPSSKKVADQRINRSQRQKIKKATKSIQKVNLQVSHDWGRNGLQTEVRSYVHAANVYATKVDNSKIYSQDDRQAYHTLMRKLVKLRSSYYNGSMSKTERMLIAVDLANGYSMQSYKSSSDYGSRQIMVGKQNLTKIPVKKMDLTMAGWLIVLGLGIISLVVVRPNVRDDAFMALTSTQRREKGDLVINYLIAASLASIILLIFIFLVSGSE